MTIKERVLQACIAVAKLKKHGHMTTVNVFDICFNAGESFTIHQVSNAMNALKANNVWRRGLPRKFQDGYLIRELKEEVWQKKVDSADEIKDLRYQLRNALKAKDAIIVEHGRYLLAVQQLEQELSTIRGLWRSLNNVMNPGR